VIPSARWISTAPIHYHTRLAWRKDRMQFGICTSIANAPAAKAAGWDYIEENVQNFLQGLLPDSQWQGERLAKASPLPIRAACCLVPGDMKITGPNVDFNKLRDYMTNVTARAKKCGIQTLVFGSGVARNVPGDFDRERAIGQITEFGKMIAALAARNGVLIVIEHLNRKECNIVNTVAEAERYVRQINSASFQNLVDCYHFWLEKEKLEDLTKAMPFIHHVHVSDVDGRLPPGESGKSDFRPFFNVLKKGGYNGPISVESLGFDDIANMGPRVLAFLKKQWAEA
jgi:sugar phosphate isomerase/epimerase